MSQGLLVFFEVESQSCQYNFQSSELLRIKYNLLPQVILQSPTPLTGILRVNFLELLTVAHIRLDLCENLTLRQLIHSLHSEYLDFYRSIYRVKTNLGLFNGHSGLLCYVSTPLRFLPLACLVSVSILYVKVLAIHALFHKNTNAAKQSFSYQLLRPYSVQVKSCICLE